MCMNEKIAEENEDVSRMLRQMMGIEEASKESQEESFLAEHRFSNVEGEETKTEAKVAEEQYGRGMKKGVESICQVDLISMQKMIKKEKEREKR